MKKLIALFIALAVPTLAQAAGGAKLMYKADIDLTNKASLQRGARMYINYCMGCHGLKFQSYGRTAKDLGLSDDLVLDNLMINWQKSTKKIGKYMTTPMKPEDGKIFFGATPPDLSLIGRSRGADWIYSYLLTFHVDKKRAVTGHNNLTFKDVGMPNVMWQLEGHKKAVYKTVKGKNGDDEKVFDRFEYLTEGTLTPAEFKLAVRDLTAFLVYVGEPGKVAHRELGVWVLLFLAIFFVIAYQLKKEYWRDIH